ncbi:MAG TPA: PAS domain S-box protein [Ohtaekwangia sp.]
MPPRRKKVTPTKKKARAMKKASGKSSPARKRKSKTPSQQLLESQARLTLALQSARMGTWELDLKTNQVEWSDEVLFIFGVTRKTFDGTFEAYKKLTHPSDWDRVYQNILDTLRTNHKYFIQHRIILPDNSVRWVEGIGQTIFSRSGKPIKMAGTVQDITDFKSKELEKEDLKTRFQLIANSSSLIIYDFHIDSGLVTWSENVQNVFGYSLSEMGNDNDWIDRVHPEDRSEILSSLDSAKESLSKFDVTYRFKRKNGDYLQIHDYGLFLTDENKKAHRMVGIMRDISETVRTAEIISQSNRLRESMENAIPGIIYVYNTRLNTSVYMSQSFYTLLGYTPREIEAMGPDFLIRLTHPDDLANFHPWTNEPQGLVKTTEYRMLAKSGEWKWLSSRDTVFQRDAEGMVTEIVGIAQDITDSKESSELIIQSARSYQDLFNSVVEAIYIHKPDGTFIDVNQGACNLYGYVREEFIGRNPGFLAAEGKNDFEAVGKHMQLAMEGEPQNFEFWGKAKNGRIFLKEVRLAKGMYFGQEIIIATARDITQQRKILDDLRESEQRFRILQEASFGGIGLHDQGLILDCNQGLCDISGYEYSELIGRNGLELIAPEWRDMVIHKIKSGYEKPYDVEGIRKDGTRYFLEIHAKNIPYHGRKIRVTEFRDITDRKRSEEKILEQNARLQAVTDDLKRKNEQLEEFTQIVSHNLRSPVGNILTLLSFFETAETESEREEYLKLLKQAGANTLNTLHELNEVLKIKQNRNIEKQELSFQTVFNNVKAMVSAQITETEAEVLHDFSAAPTLHYPAIYLESILLNLLSNALKYSSPKRKPVIKFKTYREGESTILEASDNGLGINLERYAHQVFKLRKTFHRHPESRGIGLFMIKNQIDAMGGEITVSSKEDEGTTFFINFNIHQGDEN